LIKKLRCNAIGVIVAGAAIVAFVAGAAIGVIVAGASFSICNALPAIQFLHKFHNAKAFY
jgi:hypothetical protein